MANFMRRCNGKVMDSIKDNPEIRRVSGDFHFEILDIQLLQYQSVPKKGRG